MTDYKQIIIAQVGSTSPAPLFAPYEGLIWSRNYYLSTEDQDASFWTTNFGATYDDTNEGNNLILVNTVTWNGQQLSRYDSLAELSYTLVQNAFYFDYDAQVLYIKNFYNYPPWQTMGISTGVVIGFSSSPDVGPDKRPFNQAFFGQDHDPRLVESSADDTQVLEDWQTNQMVFKNINISLINSDGELDNIRSSIMNQRLDLLLADVPADQVVENIDFNVVSTGVVTDVSFPDANTVTILASDRRKAWEDTIPDNVYTVGFGGMDQTNENIGKNMPLVVGDCLKVPCVTINDTTGNYHVSFCSSDYPLQAVSAVYTYSDEIYTSVGYTVDLTTGIITLDTPGDAENGTISCDVLGINAPSISGGIGSDSPLDIAVLLTSIWGGMPYVPSIFDMDTINAIRNQRNFLSGIYIPIGGEVLRDVIERCTFSVNTVLYQAGSLISAAVITPSDEPVTTIYPDRLSTMPGIAYGTGDYMSRISVGYAKDHTRDVSNTWYDDQFEQDALNAYQYKVQYDLETILEDEVPAAEVAYERYRIEWKITPDLTLQFQNPIDFDFLDTVAFDYYMNGRQMVENAMYRVTSISKIKRTARLEYVEEIA